MDRLMTAVGLHGKSFVPLVLGFGCGVPAVYATRTLEGKRERLITALMVPLMSCSARLPVYLVFSLAFFPRSAHLVIFALYGLGTLTAIGSGLILSRWVFRTARPAPFLMELPPYRRPTARNLWLGVRIRISAFVRQAGTVILGVSLAVWMLTHLPVGTHDLRHSWFGAVSARLAPAFSPAGFGRWEASGALMTGFAAKEMVVSTMSQILTEPPTTEGRPAAVRFFADLGSIGRGFVEATIRSARELGETVWPIRRVSTPSSPPSALVEALRVLFTPAAAAAFLVFVLLYVPCAATLAALRAEFGWRWAAFSAIYQTCLAWAAAVAVFQLSRLIGVG
jgi:ferrous iron transport protein B